MVNWIIIQPCRNFFNRIRREKNAGIMGRDAEKKDLVGPCQRSGLAAGRKPQAEDGGN